MITSRRRRAGYIAALTVLITACSHGGSGGGGTAASATVASIGVLPTSVSLNVGLSKQVLVTAYDSNNSAIGNVSFTWTSSDDSVASVDANGVVTGEAQGTANITAAANGVTSNVATVNVAPASDLHPLAFQQLTLPVAQAGMPYSVTLAASGGSPPYRWGGAVTPPDYLTSGGSNGLTLNQYNGLLSGTPTFGGLIPVSITLTDSYGFSTTIATELHVTPGTTTMEITNAPPGGTQGTPYNFQFTTSWTDQTGCPANMLLHSGVIPPGLIFNYSQGSLTGTPVVAGQFTFSVSAGTGSACEPTVSTPYTDVYTYTVTIAPGTNTAPDGVSGWQRQSATAVLDPANGSWDNYSLTSPSVIKVGNTWMMYYGGEDATNHIRQIGLATSTDGVNWTRNPDPVLGPGAPGDFDSFEVMYPSVAYDGTTFHMWYLGASLNCNAIGEATSSDGIHWTKHAGALNFGNCNTLGKNYAPGPVIYNSGTYTMWYWAPAGTAIGKATSTDGITWSDDGPISFDSAFTTRVTIDRPSVIFDGTKYRMWFGMTRSMTYFASANIYRTAIGYASSSDGVKWTGYDDTGSSQTYAIFSPGNAGAWDRPGVGEPWVVLDNGTYRMWYAGGPVNVPIPGYFGYVEGAIGYAVIQ